MHDNDDGPDRIVDWMQHLSDMIVAVHSLAGDISAMGPWLNMRRTSLGQPDLRTSLEDLSILISAIAKDFEAGRAEYVQTHLASLPTELRDGPKLHIGCGQRQIPAWINIDLFPAQLALDVRRGLPFPDSSVSYIFMAHAFEHLYYPSEANALAREFRRVLRPGGTARLIVPDIEKFIQAYASDDRAFFDGRSERWKLAAGEMTKLEHFLSYAGAASGPTGFFRAHRFAYDFETLSKVFRRVGFANIVRSDYMQSEHLELRVDDYSAVAGASYSGGHYSMFVEVQ